MEFQEAYIEAEKDEMKLLLEFMFQLTIFGREIHMDLVGEKQSSATKQLNEINHRVLNRLRDISSESSWSDRSYVIDTVSTHISNAPFIKSRVDYCASKALSKLSA